MSRQRKHVQQARAFLFTRHPNGFGIPPHKFAAASDELGMPFDQLLKFISRMYAGGQNQELFRQQDIAAAAAGARA